MNTPLNSTDKQILVTKLITGQATQEERDTALATVMLSQWGNDELRDFIRLVHREECSKCPYKKSAAAQDGESQWRKLTMMLVKYGGWLILIIAGLLKISIK